MRLFLLLFSVLWGSVQAFAAEGPPRPFTQPNSEVIPFRSDMNGVDYELYVSVPKDYPSTDKTYPLLVTLDADYQFVIASNQIARLASHNGQAPEMIVVSIGYAYDPDDLHAYRLNRTRDYTPEHAREGGYGPDYQKVSGGGPVFADVIADEILPFIEARYRVEAEERVFVGHSYGGLFGGWLLIERPEIFNRYILVSPSFWYKERMMLNAAAQAKPQPRKAYVYMGVGAWEGDMVPDLNAFAAALEAHEDPNLVIETRTYEDETHASIYPAVLSTGIRHLYGTMDD